MVTLVTLVTLVALVTLVTLVTLVCGNGSCASVCRSPLDRFRFACASVKPACVSSQHMQALCIYILLVFARFAKSLV